MRDPALKLAPTTLLTLACGLAAILFAGYVDFARLREDELSDGRDIYHLYLDGQRLLHHENPYARTLGNTTGINQKYATYFPIFYLLSAGSQTFVPGYPQFISFWRPILFVFYIGIGLLLSWPFYQRGWMICALAVLLIWLFNRWSLTTVRVMFIDVMPIALLLASLLMLDRCRRTAFLLLGLSLGIKQIGIFLVPLYLVWEWNASEATDPRTRLRNTLAAAFWIALIPAIVCLPFFVWGPKALIKSVLFSAVRTDDFKGMPAQSLDDLLHWKRSIGKLPMFGLMGLLYLAAWRKQLGRYSSAMLVMAVFVTFNAIWFRQYEAWLIALLPWVALDGGSALPDKSPAAARS